MVILNSSVEPKVFDFVFPMSFLAKWVVGDWTIGKEGGEKEKKKEWKKGREREKRI